MLTVTALRTLALLLLLSASLSAFAQLGDTTGEVDVGDTLRVGIVSGLDCGSENPGSPCVDTQVTDIRGGTTFTWHFHCDGGPCWGGRFVNGEPWVKHPTGGDVTITSVTPNDADSGLEKNPGSGAKAASNDQGLITGNIGGDYVVGLDLSTQMPFDAPPDNGVYVKVNTFTSSPNCYTSAAGTRCAQAYSALTVLQNLPPDGKLGKETFRPSSAETSKTFVTLDDIDLSSLPSLSAISGGDYASAATALSMPWPDYYLESNADQGRRYAPSGAWPNYSGDISNTYMARMFLLFSDDAVEGDKLAAVYAMVQRGIELFGAWQEGNNWNCSAGQCLGRWPPVLFYGAVAKSTATKDAIKAIANDADTIGAGFQEINQIRLGVNDAVIWGHSFGTEPQAPCPGGSYGGHGRYWADYAESVLRSGSGKRTCGDPYGYIDGPAEAPGRHYFTCCSVGPYVSMALAMKIWPEMDEVANFPAMVSFAERVMDGAGFWSQPDQCAIVDPREDSSCDPWTTTTTANTCDFFGDTWGYNNSTSSCVTISEATSAGHPDPGERWPERHLAGRPDMDRTGPGGTYWDTLAD